MQFAEEITGVVVADADVEDGACELVLRALQLLEVFIQSFWHNQLVSITLCK